jgi:hypothetical protein
MTVHNTLSKWSFTVAQTAPVHKPHFFQIGGHFGHGEDEDRAILTTAMYAALDTIEALPQDKAPPGAQAFNITIAADHDGAPDPRLPKSWTNMPYSFLVGAQKAALGALESLFQHAPERTDA